MTRVLSSSTNIPSACYRMPEWFDHIPLSMRLFDPIGNDLIWALSALVLPIFRSIYVVRCIKHYLLLVVGHATIAVHVHHVYSGNTCIENECSFCLFHLTYRCGNLGWTASKKATISWWYHHIQSKYNQVLPSQTEDHQHVKKLQAVLNSIGVACNMRRSNGDSRGDQGQNCLRRRNGSVVIALQHFNPEQARTEWSQHAAADLYYRWLNAAPKLLPWTAATTIVLEEEANEITVTLNSHMFPHTRCIVPLIPVSSLIRNRCYLYLIASSSDWVGIAANLECAIASLNRVGN